MKRIGKARLSLSVSLVALLLGLGQNGSALGVSLSLHRDLPSPYASALTPFLLSDRPGRSPDRWTGPMSSVGLTVPKVIPKNVTRANNRDWMRAMESSISELSERDPQTEKGQAEIQGWGGWVFAFLLFVGIVALQARFRNHTRYMFRAGERDVFILPPPGKGWRG